MIAPDKATPIERYARLAEAGRRAGPAWLNELAGAANEVFRAQGFPDRRNEDWRYTTLSKLLEQAWVPAVPNTAVQFSDLDDLLIAGLQSWRIVLVNGRFEPRLSTLSDLPDGVWVGGLAKALETHGDRLRLHVGPARAAPAAAFANLTLAGAADGAAILLDAG
ncbi:MAG: Fe-S cluster assembly protein SufD, partial [Gammaproteobacteria bacterium]